MLNYSSTNKVESSMSRSYRSNIAPQNGTSTYNAGDTIIINIPTRNNLCLATTESYLKFDVAFKNGASAGNCMRWDSGGSHGVIQRIRIFSGSNLISDVDNYNLLAKMLFDTNVSTDATYGKYNITSGTRNDLTVKMPALTTTTTLTTSTTPSISAAGQADLSALSAFNLQALQTNSGDTVGINIPATSYTTSQTYCLNLISLVGTLCNTQYFPLWACKSAPLRVEITLVDQVVKCLACVTAPDTSNLAIQVTNCEYVASFMELSDEAIGMITSSLGGEKLQFVFNDYRNYSYSGVTINPTGTNTTVQTQFSIPAKFSSVKSLFVMQRDRGLGAIGYFPHSCVNGGMNSYQFRIGSLILPPKPPVCTTTQDASGNVNGVNSSAEYFCELSKAVTGSMSDLNHAPSIERSSYGAWQSAKYIAELTANGPSTINSGSHYIGIDLESYSGSDRSQIFCGYSTNTDDIYFIGSINITVNGSTSSYNPRFDAFASFDSVIVFENDTAYVVF